MKIRVDVTLKPGVLDPQGRAVEQSLHHLGFEDVTDVRVGKLIELTFKTQDVSQAKAQAAAMAEKLLANGVIENYALVTL